MIKIYCKHIIFKEIVDSLYLVFKKKKYNISITDKIINNNNLYIILGANDFYEILPKYYIIYQFEQTNVKSKWFNSKYLNILKNAIAIWDYSKSNINYLKNIVNNQINFVPLKYIECIDKSSKKTNIKDIDILFLGSINDRRKYIIDELKKKYKVYVATNIWNTERDLLIKRAKIIINIHFYNNGILEMPRINYLLSNKCIIVSEPGREKNLAIKMDKYMILCKYNKLLSYINIYLNKKQDNLNEIRNKFYKEWKKTSYYDSFKFLNNCNYNKYFKITNKKNYKKGKIKYYIPNIIQSIEYNILDDGSCVLKLPEISSNDLPYVSIITPTKNRGHLFNIALNNFYNFNYPQSKLEWIILDNGRSIKNIIPNDKRIKYYKLPDKKYSIGFLRNECIKLSTHNYICYMDDDDYYRPESVLARIKSLIKYKNKNIECVGCVQVGCYNIINKQSVIGNNSKYFLSEASLCHTKKFWIKRKYNDNDFIGEYKHFLSYRQQYTLSIPYQFIMIAINHSQNTTGNNRIFKNYNKWMHDNNSNFSYYNLFDDSLKKILNNISIK